MDLPEKASLVTRVEEIGIRNKYLIIINLIIYFQELQSSIRFCIALAIDNITTPLLFVP
jgi:hypothetical protein